MSTRKKQVGQGGVGTGVSGGQFAARQRAEADLGAIDLTASPGVSPIGRDPGGNGTQAALDRTMKELSEAREALDRAESRRWLPGGKERAARASNRFEDALAAHDFQRRAAGMAVNAAHRAELARMRAEVPDLRKNAARSLREQRSTRLPLHALAHGDQIYWGANEHGVAKVLTVTGEPSIYPEGVTSIGARQSDGSFAQVTLRRDEHVAVSGLDADRAPSRRAGYSDPDTGF